MDTISLQCFKGQANEDGSKPYKFSYVPGDAGPEADMGSDEAEDAAIMDLLDDGGDAEHLAPGELGELSPDSESSSDQDGNSAAAEHRSSGDDELPASFHECEHAKVHCEKDDVGSDPHSLVTAGSMVAHVFNEGGWAVGRVVKVGNYKTEGHVAWVKYPDASFHYSHRLKNEDYGATWLIVQRKAKP